MSKSCQGTPGDGGPAPAYHIVGTIVDDSIAYTLFRQSDRGAPAEAPLAIFPPHVLQLRLDHGSWWVIPNREMSGTMGMMVQCQTVVPKKPGGA